MRLQLLDRIEAVLHQIAQRDEARADPLVGDLEDALLGFVEDLVGVLGAGVGLDEDVVGALVISARSVDFSLTMRA